MLNLLNIGIDSRAVVGCKDVSFEVVKDLGFVIEREKMRLVI